MQFKSRNEQIPLEGSFKEVALECRIGGMKEIISSSNIVMCEVYGNYTKIYLNDSRIVLQHESLKKISNKLPDGSFLYVHVSRIVNAAYIEKYRSFSNGTGIAILRNQQIVDISKRKRAEFLRGLRSYYSIMKSTI